MGDNIFPKRRNWLSGTNYIFLPSHFCICLEMQRRIAIVAIWNNCDRSVLSVLFVPAHQNRTHKIMHHVFKTWCIVSMSGRFAKSAPPVRSAGGAFCRFPVPLCICPPLPLSRCVGTNSVKMYCACSARVQLPLSAKFKYCFTNCSLYFADNVLYYPCAESEGSL